MDPEAVLQCKLYTLELYCTHDAKEISWVGGSASDALDVMDWCHIKSVSVTGSKSAVTADVGEVLYKCE